MLYLLTNATEYTGQFQDGDSEAARAALIVMGLRPVWMDGTPAFHQRWVETPAAEGEDEIRITLTVGELREVRLAELDHLTRKFDDELVNPEMWFNSSLGFPVDADIRSQNNLRGLQATGAGAVAFMGHDNELHQLTQEGIATLLSECAQNGSHLYAQRWAFKAAIAAAETIAELEAIEIRFEMMDFSK